MYQILFNDSKLYITLFEMDVQIAGEFKLNGCPICGNALHQANYQRKPRGIPSGVDAHYCIRFSFCCGQEGCRKRAMPPSLRFLGRKVYTSIIIVLLFTIEANISQQISTLNNCLDKWVSLSEETIQRWRHYWKAVFPEGNLWKKMALDLHIKKQQLPNSLLDYFHKVNPKETFIQFMTFACSN